MKIIHCRKWLVFNANFSSISAISWRELVIYMFKCWYTWFMFADQYFVQNVDFLNQTVQYTPYLWHRNSISRLQCCALCNLDNSCRSAIFDNGECYGTDLLTISSAHGQQESIQVFTKQDYQSKYILQHLPSLLLRKRPLYFIDQIRSEMVISAEHSYRLGKNTKDWAKQTPLKTADKLRKPSER
jgi:hypothetical protein